MMLAGAIRVTGALAVTVPVPNNVELWPRVKVLLCREKVVVDVGVISKVE
jgi:hypothetical protein